MKVKMFLVMLLAVISVMSLTPTLGAENCMQLYSTVVLIDTERHPDAIQDWRTEMYGKGRIISEYDHNHEYYIFELRERSATTNNNVTEEKVYIFTQHFDVSLIQDSCSQPITKVLTLSRDIPNDLLDITADSVKIVDITNRH